MFKTLVICLTSSYFCHRLIHSIWAMEFSHVVSKLKRWGWGVVKLFGQLSVYHTSMKTWVPAPVPTDKATHRETHLESQPWGGRDRWGDPSPTPRWNTSTQYPCKKTYAKHKWLLSVTPHLCATICTGTWDTSHSQAHTPCWFASGWL